MIFILWKQEGEKEAFELFYSQMMEKIIAWVKLKIDNAKQVLEAARVVYTADVACPEIKFLGLGERRAAVQFLITPGLRYRLMARAPKEGFEQRKEAIDAFFASFRILP